MKNESTVPFNPGQKTICSISMFVSYFLWNLLKREPLIWSKTGSEVLILLYKT